MLLAVGGTMLTGETDVVWWESPGERTSSGGGSTGGGVSVVFPRPSWQDVKIASINPGSIDGRVVPDIAALAGPPLYDLIFMGEDSAERRHQRRHARVGGADRAAGRRPQPWKPRFLAPLLYAPGRPARARSAPPAAPTSPLATTPHRRSARGTSAGPGFDAVSGWGVPNGVGLLTALAGRAQG